MAGRKKNPNRHKLGGSFWDEADEEDTSHPNNGHDSSTAGLNEGNASEKNSKPSSSSEPRTVASVEDDWGEWENVEDANRKASDGASRPRTARYSSGSDDLYSDVASTVPLKYSGNSDDSRYDYLSFRPRRRLTPVSSPRSKGKARSGYGIRSNRVPNSPPTFYSPYPQLFTGYPPTIPSFPGIHQAYGAQIPLSGYPSVPPVPSGGSERGSPAHVGGNHEAATLVSGRPQHAFPNFTDGLAFNVEVRCSYTTLNSRFSTAMQQYWPDQLAHAELGDLRVHSVLSSKRFKNRSGRHCIELACSNGPSHNQNTEQFQMHWLHMQRDTMDLSEFEDIALNAPNINEELKFVVLKLFKRVREECRKKFFDGFHIEQGTVLRCDGSSTRSLAGGDLSATFLCFPYITLKHRRRVFSSTSQDYPMRSMLQTLYPYESTSGRDVPPAFCKDLPKLSRDIMYIPQLWAIVIGSRYVVTCAEANIDVIRGSSVTAAKELRVDKRIAPSHKKPHTKVHAKSAQFRDTEAIVEKNTGSSVKQMAIERSEPAVAAEDQLPAAIHDFNQPTISGYQEKHKKSEDGNPNENNVEDVLDPPNRPGTRVYKSPTVEDASDESARSLYDVPRHKSSIRPDFDIRAEVRKFIVSSFHEQRDSHIAMLMSLGKPEMERQYFTALLESMKGLLELRADFQVTELSSHNSMITQLEESVQCAELLQAMYQLEVENEYFAEHLEYREAMIKTLGTKDSTFAQELQSLDRAVQDAIHFFSTITLKEDILERPDFDTPFTTPRPQDFQAQARVESVTTIPQETDDLSSHEIDDESLYDDPSEMTESEIPPFLTWAGLDPEFKESIPARRLAAENLYTIMEDIDRNLCYLSKRDSVPYTKTPEIAFHEWEKGLAFLDTKSSQEENALTYGCSSGRRHSVYLTGDCSAEDIVLTSHRKEIASVLEELSSVVKEFVSLFVPFSYDHCVVKKIWGALHTIASNLMSSSSKGSSFVESQRQLWYIRPLTKENTEKGNVEQPPIPIEDCRDCRRGMAYTNPDHGIRHLKRHHFLSSPTFERLTRTGLVYNWLRTQGQVNTETQNGQQLRLLRICLKYITVLRNRAKNISDGISRSQNDNSAKYQLPNDLIDCFEATAVFISQAATSINAIKEDVIPWLQPGYFNWQPETPTVTYALNRLGQLGQNAQASMTRAEKTLALSDPETDMMTMGPAGPEFLVSVICQNLQRQEPLDGVEMDINELYQSCSSKLQYQVNQFPRKRLLRDIHSLQEELSAVKSVNEWQQKAYSNYIKVLDHHTFENATPNRKAMFPSESECLKSGLNYLQSKATELEALDNRTRQLRDHLKESVEILEEDHGKAILVFTMITTIFLPLSFITSFFGMNTADIRNTNYTQGFFWAIALPVTASIVGISVLVAYQGDKLYDAAIKIFHHIKQDPQAMSMMHPGFESIDKTKRNLPFHARPWDWRKRRRFGARRPEVDAVLLS